LLGIALILLVSFLAYEEYRSAGSISIPTGIESSLASVLSVFSVIAIKAIFLSLIIWGGSILLSNGIKLMRVKTEKGEKE